MKKNFQIKPQNYGFPSNIGGLIIKTISWKDFPAKPPENTWFLAYTYWNTNYTCTSKNGKGKTVATVSIGPKAWTRAKQDFRLLQHQTGHYWIACLCALQFMKRVNYIEQQPKDIPFLQFCQKIFKKTSSQFFLQQKRYDKQTYHYLNQQDQDRWQLEMVEKFKQYHQFFEQKKKQQEKLQAINKKKTEQNSLNKIRSRNIKSLPSNQIKNQKLIQQQKKRNQFNIRKQNNRIVPNNLIQNKIGAFNQAKNTLMKNIQFLDKLK